MKKIYSLSPSASFFITVLGIIAIGLAMKELQSIFLPLFIAYFLFLLFQPLNIFLEKYKIPKPIIIISNIAIVYFLVYGATSFLIESAIRFSDAGSSYLPKLNALIVENGIKLGISEESMNSFTIEEQISKLDYGKLAGGVLTSTVDLAGSILMVLFYYVFIVSGYSGIMKAIHTRYVEKRRAKEFRAIEEEFKTAESAALPITETEELIDAKKHEVDEKLESTFKKIPEQIQRYVITKMIINLGAGISIFFLMWAIGIDFPEIWGILTFFMNFIPTIGSAIALILPGIMTLIQTGSVSSTLLVIGAIAVVQTLFFNILEPIFLGKRLNLNPLVILMSVLIWGYVWGIVGMLLAVPFTAILKIIISNIDSKNMRFISDLMSQK
ncbi:MAG: AI-2E family transporter [Ignavibacteriaceae bacterium]|nr:AI-2E family transporter [Ignavibacteriaceae bacterium]